MVARADLLPELRPPLLHIPLQALRADHRRLRDGDDADILSQLRLRHGRVDPVPPLPQQEDHALGREQVHVPALDLGVFVHGVEVVDQRERLVGAPAEAADDEHVEGVVHGHGALFRDFVLFGFAGQGLAPVPVAEGVLLPLRAAEVAEALGQVGGVLVWVPVHLGA